MDIYEGKCTCDDDDCAITLTIEPVYRVSVHDDNDNLSATQTMTRDELLNWLCSDEECEVEDADNLYSIEPDAAAVWQWLDGAEAADMRRQVEHANRWRDSAILEANEARQEAADLRRQLAEERMRANAAEFAVAQQRDEAADLRRQVGQARTEAGMLRRQLQEGEQSALSQALGQIAYLRRQLGAVPMDAIADLYTAYAYAVAGKPAAQQFPQLGRWLGILPAADTPHG